LYNFYFIYSNLSKKGSAMPEVSEVSMHPQKSPWWTAALFVMGCEGVGFASSYLGGAFKKQAWIDPTPKPAIWPPQWVFPFVWVGNYFCMGLAAWNVWRQRGKTEVSGALGVFGIHLLHNFVFIPLVNKVKKRSFYTIMDTMGLGLATITTLRFRPISRIASRWMLPYLGWLCFTTIIKFLWWQMEESPKRRA
jgi:tryptophan-rich sensory protein